LSNIRYRYPGTAWVLDGIDLSVEAGEYVAVFGANGSGKSTLGYLLNGLVPHFFGGALQGAVIVNETDTRDVPVCELMRYVGLVLQNADAQLFNSTVEDEIAFGLESLGLSGGEIQNRIEAVSQMLQLDAILAQAPDTLSGGEKRLAAIAAVMCLEPSVLLLDEPFADLDWQAVQRVSRLLRQIHQSGKTVIVIEQQPGGYLQDCTRCIIMDQGKIVFDGNRRDAYDELKQRHLVPSYSLRSRRIRPPDNDTVLVVHGLSFDRGPRRILSDISLDFRRGEAVALVGPNGSGKTTLIKHFNGLLRPTDGELRIAGETLRGQSPAQLAQAVGVCFQNANDQFFKYTVEEEIAAGTRALKSGNGQWLQTVCRLLELNEFFDRSPYRLSEGEKKRVAIASILVMRPDILILDEPTVGQDGRFKEALAKLLRIFEDLGVTIIVVTHDLEFAQAAAERWIVLHRGRVAADGPPADLLRDRRLIGMGALDCAANESRLLRRSGVESTSAPPA